MGHRNDFTFKPLAERVCSFKLMDTHISFSHLMVGEGSPTALQGSTMSLIQGVVTVLLKVRIRAGAARVHTCFISPTQQTHQQLNVLFLCHFPHSLSSLTSSLTQPKLQAHRAESDGVSLSPSEEERTSITWTSDKMCMSCKSLRALTPDTRGAISICNQLISSHQAC